jgi:hypothetical protein
LVEIIASVKPTWEQGISTAVALLDIAEGRMERWKTFTSFTIF